MDSRDRIISQNIEGDITVKISLDEGRVQVERRGIVRDPNDDDDCFNFSRSFHYYDSLIVQLHLLQTLDITVISTMLQHDDHDVNMLRVKNKQEQRISMQRNETRR